MASVSTTANPVTQLKQFFLIPAHNWEAFMGSTNDPEDGVAVGTTCYVAALIYGAFVLFCGCQIGVHRRYSRIRI